MAYRKLAEIHIKSKLIANQVELVVLGGGVHKVETTSNVLARALGNELQRQRVSTGLNTISTGVISSIQDTVGGASLVIRAERSVPSVSSVA